MINVLKELKNRLHKENTYDSFRGTINADLNAQGEFDRLRNEEKTMNLNIKALNDQYKKLQDEWAKEANETNQEILN